MFLVVSVSARAQEFTPPAIASQLPDNLVVAWVENGNLFAWTPADGSKQLDSGNVIFPVLAPDGGNIAYLRGQGGLPESLWVTDIRGENARELLTAEDLPVSEDETLLIGQIAWLDRSTTYFNTIRQSSLGQDRRDDLWMATIETGEVVMLLPPGEGGAFSISPDRQHIAVMNPGTYGEADGFIHLIETQTGRVINSQSFAAVSTGSEYRFYPEVFWEMDSSALRVAIPDKDLIYDDIASPPVALWRLGIDGSNEQPGSVNASFFGLPRWSWDTTYLTYLRRVGDQTSNLFELLIADGNGENAATYAIGDAGTIGAPIWLPDTTQFVYAQGEPGEYWLGSPDTAPRHVPHSMYTPKYLGNSGIVYFSFSINTFYLRFAYLDDSASALIATLTQPVPALAFDALILPDTDN